MNKKNYLKHTWTHPAFTVKKSNISGKGIYTSKPIKKGEVVMIMGGELLKSSEEVYDKYKEMSLFLIDDDHELGVPISDPFNGVDEFLNHSCDPNTWLIDEVTVVARRNIKAGEEITLDSSTWYSDTTKEWLYSEDGKCYCQSKYCRKVFTYEDWKNKDLQKKYQGHFSPYIQAKIDKENSK